MAHFDLAEREIARAVLSFVPGKAFSLWNLDCVKKKSFWDEPVGHPLTVEIHSIPGARVLVALQPAVDIARAGAANVVRAVPVVDQTLRQQLVIRGRRVGPPLDQQPRLLRIDDKTPVRPLLPHLRDPAVAVDVRGVCGCDTVQVSGTPRTANRERFQSHRGCWGA